jgi:hypothetical protein
MGREKGALTGPSPVDRGKPGSKIHAVTERGGLPLATTISAANTPDAALLLPLVDAIPPVSGKRGRPRRRPAKLRADKAYDDKALRTAVQARGIAVRIARKAVESSQRLGRHRWVVERTIVLAHALPPPRTPLRPLPRTLHRVHHHRVRADLPPPTTQTNQMRRGLSYQLIVQSARRGVQRSQARRGGR